MSLYSYKNQYPETLPFRIVLSNGTTRTDPSTFTAEEIEDAGYVLVDFPPEVLDSQILSWNSDDAAWAVLDKSESQVALEQEKQWEVVREKRDQLLQETDYVVLVAYEKSEPIAQRYLDYRQNLRDIPQFQDDPFSIVWPELFPEEYYSA